MLRPESVDRYVDRLLGQTSTRPMPGGDSQLDVRDATFGLDDAWSSLGG